MTPDLQNLMSCLHGDLIYTVQFVCDCGFRAIITAPFTQASHLYGVSLIRSSLQLSRCNSSSLKSGDLISIGNGDCDLNCRRSLPQLN